MTEKEQDLSKDKQSQTESAPTETFGTFFLTELEERLKAITQEPSFIERDKKALDVLADIVISTAVEFIEDDPNEPELPEKKLVMLPFGDIYVAVQKQSQANFLIEHFGATEPIVQLPKGRRNSYPYIETQRKIFSGNKGRKFELHHIFGGKGNIINTSVQRDKN